MIVFGDRLENDQEFKDAFVTYKELNGFLEHKFENKEASKAFESNLKTISDTYFKTETSTKKVVKFTPWKYAVAASVVVLLGFFVFNNFSDPTYNDFAKYNTISLTVRGAQDSAIKTAENAFNSQDFEKAEDAFRALLLRDKNNTELQFYRAITNIELDKFEVAERLLKDLSQGNSVYKHKATWYLALSKLKQEDNEACISILKTITESAEDYKQAQKLLKKLD